MKKSFENIVTETSENEVKEFEFIFQETPIPCLIFTDNFNITHINKEAISFFKMVKDGIINHNLLDFILKDDHNKLINLIDKTIKENNAEEIFNFIVEQSKAISVNTLVKKNQKPDNSYCLFVTEKITNLSEITEQKKEEEKLKKYDNAIFELSISEHFRNGNFADFIKLVTELSSASLDVERVSVWFYSDDLTELLCYDLFERTNKTHSSGMVLNQSAFENEFAALKSSIYIDANNARTDKRTKGYTQSYLKPLNIFSMLDVSIKTPEKLIGLLCFEHTNKRHNWKREEISFGCQVVDQIIIAINNKEKIASDKNLAELETNYKILFETLTLGVVCQDSNGNIILANPAAERILGFSFNQMTGLTSFDPRWHAIHPDGSPFPGETHPAMISLKTGKVQKNVVMGAYNILKNDYVWIKVESVPHFRPGETKPFQVYVIFQDISEQIIAEKSLKESEHKFRTIFEDAADANLLISNGIFIDCNKAVLSMMDCDRDYIVGKKAYDLSPKYQPDGKKSSEQSGILIEQCIKNGSVKFEWVHTKPDKTCIWVEVILTSVFISGSNVIFTNWRDISARVKAQGELIESEKRYRQLVEFMPDGIIVHCGGKIVFSNKKTLDILGIDSELEIIGQNIMNYVHPDYRDRVIERIKSASKTCIPMPILEEKFILPNGNVLDVEVSSIPIIFNNKPSFLVIFHDISDRIITQKITHFRIELIDYLSSHNINEILIKTLDTIAEFTGSSIGFYHFVNQDEKTIALQAWSTNTIKEFCRIDKLDSHYPIGKAGVWADCFYSKKPVIHNDYINLDYKKGLPEGHAQIIRELVIPILREEKVVALLGIGNKQSDYIQNDVEFVSILADISYEVVERKRAIEELKESELRYSAIVNNSPEIILIHQNGVIVFVNNACLDISGFRRDELLKNSIFNYLTENSKIIVHSNLEKRIKGIKVEGYEIEFITKSGVVKTFIVKTEPILFGKEPGILAILVDITERKLNEEKIKEYSAELKEANETKDKFFSIISHDLKSPMHGMLGASEILAKEIDRLPKEKISRFATELHLMLKNQNQLLEDLLTWSSIQMGRMEIKFSDFLVNQELNSTFSLMEMIASKKDIELINFIPDDIDLIADRNMFNLLFRNLLSNSIKFSFRGGKIELSYEFVDNQKQFMIQDYGVGIDENRKKNLFLLSKQFSSLGTEKEKGTGLGLILCKEIMEKHNGSIRIESEYGKGTKFILQFPND